MSCIWERLAETNVHSAKIRARKDVQRATHTQLQATPGVDGATGCTDFPFNVANSSSGGVGLKDINIQLSQLNELLEAQTCGPKGQINRWTNFWNK